MRDGLWMSEAFIDELRHTFGSLDTVLLLEQPAAFGDTSGTTAIIIVVGIGVLTVAGKVAVDTWSDTTDDSSTGGQTGRGEHRPQTNETPGNDARVAFEERIGETTVDRLEPIIPAAVSRVRRRLPLDNRDDMREVDSIEQELREGIENAIGDRRFDPSVESAFSEQYEIVNLPGQHRECTLSHTQQTIYINEIERTASEVAESTDLREAARTLSVLYEHCRDIESYVRRQEDQFVERYETIEEALDDIHALTNRLEQSLGNRVAEFVVEGRHDAVESTVEIERQLEAATTALHRCAFEDALRLLEDAHQQSDELLVTVDFLGGVLGTVDHGEGTVEIPEQVPVELIEEITPIIEQEYDISVTIEQEKIIVEDPHANQDRQAGSASTGETASSRGSQSGEEHRSELTPEAAADEILFILRELDGIAKESTVQYQTGQLPEGIASADVLDELARFCRRQTDVVTAVQLQENAPPGFFEIEFAERTDARSGLETIRRRFTERHAS